MKEDQIYWKRDDLMSKYYICDKENNEIVYGYLNYNKVDGFRIKPRNNLEYDGIEVGRLILVEPTLIEKVLKRKTKIKLNAYLNFLISILDSEDDESSDLSLVLDDTKKYKALIMNKYSKFLNPIYIKELLYRVKFVEDELKARINENSKYMKNSRGRGGK